MYSGTHISAVTWRTVQEHIVETLVALKIAYQRYLLMNSQHH